jgi:hypothetical protein
MKKYKTQKERIIEFMRPNGTDNKIKWFTHKLIVDDVNNYFGSKRKSISDRLLGLIISGHVERALKPDELKKGSNGKKEYIYRWTGKEYIPPDRKTLKTYHKNHADNIAIGKHLYSHYPHLPKWFRLMMLN